MIRLNSGHSPKIPGRLYFRPRRLEFLAANYTLPSDDKRCRDLFQRQESAPASHFPPKMHRNSLPTERTTAEDAYKYVASTPPTSCAPILSCQNRCQNYRSRVRFEICTASPLHSSTCGRPALWCDHTTRREQQKSPGETLGRSAADLTPPPRPLCLSPLAAKRKQLAAQSKVLIPHDATGCRRRYDDCFMLLDVGNTFTGLTY